MNRNLLSVGVVILLVGLFLMVAFWPMTGVDAKQLADDSDNWNYESYDEGDEVKVYGTITDINKDLSSTWESLGLGKLIILELDGDLTVAVSGKDDIDFSEGDQVYGNFELDTFLLGEYWHLEGELRSKTTLDYVFYGVTGLGIGVALVGAIKD
ncbi:MAG: hypothetical protein ACQESD_01465 [Thermoplasmatota archaeon]